MDIECNYEEEDFDLDGILYRPDFWLPKQNCWFEVKGPLPTGEEKEKARRLALHTKRNVYLAFGDMPNPNPSWYSLSCLVLFPDGSEDEAYWWCECPGCGMLGLESEARAAHLPCGCLSHSERLDRSNYYYSTRLLRAYSAARDADVYRKSGEADLLVPSR
jgi:hypothetical protein